MYIPISNIISSGYTNGDDFVFELDLQPYVGFYFIDKENNVYTGKTYTNDSVRLLRLNPTSTSVFTPDATYTSLNPKTLPPLSIKPDFILPTENDYEKGYFVRFVLKPTISSFVNDFIEINFDKYVSIIQDNDAKVLYKPVSLVWKLTGPLHDVYVENIKIEAGIINSNERSIIEAEKALPNLSLYFTDLSQFGRPN
jgi:hypothetical protein